MNVSFEKHLIFVNISSSFKSGNASGSQPLNLSYSVCRFWLLILNHNYPVKNSSCFLLIFFLLLWIINCHVMNHKGNWLGTCLDTFWMNKETFTRAGFEPATSGPGAPPTELTSPILTVSLFCQYHSPILSISFSWGRSEHTDRNVEL